MNVYNVHVGGHYPFSILGRTLCYTIVLISPKNRGYKATVCSTNHKTWDEKTARNAGSIRPTGHEEIHQKDDPESGEREGT